MIFVGPSSDWRTAAGIGALDDINDLGKSVLEFPEYAKYAVWFPVRRLWRVEPDQRG